MFDLIPFYFNRYICDIFDRQEDENFMCKCAPSFKKMNDTEYVLEIPVDEDVTKDNVSVNVENEDVLTIDYAYRTDKSSKAYSFRETLPSDAVPSTLKAKFYNGTLSISVSCKTGGETISRNVNVD